MKPPPGMFTGMGTAMKEIFFDALKAVGGWQVLARSA